jgi:hypothetical protein
MTRTLHLVTCEYPPAIGGVSEHSRVLARAAADAGFGVEVWTSADGPSSHGIRVRPALGDFSAGAIAQLDAELDTWPSPRRILVQWVPHGYGRKGLNVAFSRWVAARARAGDELDVIVHEPFVDFLGGSWRQPAMAVVQRYMTWTVVRSARRVWVTIPGWEPRLRLARRAGAEMFHTLPVPGTIPPVRDAAAAAALRVRLLHGRSRLVGYFGSGGRYPLAALRATVAALAGRDAAFVCIGRGSEALAADLNGLNVPVTATGALDLEHVSLHLQACDVLVQPYPDGVSGRRTTTVSALEHGVPVATTFGALSEPFWCQRPAVETVPAADADSLPAAVVKLLEPARNAAARRDAAALYRERFDPVNTFAALFRAAALAAVD